MKGGYRIIDLKNTDITVSGDAVKVEGVHQSIEANYRKPIILSGITLGGLEKPDAWVNFYVSGTDYKGVIGKTDAGADLTITITDDDMVTVA